MTTQPTTNPTGPTLTEIAAAQQANSLFAFDRGNEARELVRLQRLYTAKKDQLETLYYFFDEGQPDLVIRSAGQELALRLPAACPQVGEVYAALRDALSDELQELERRIVAAHQDVARAHDEAQRYGHAPAGQPDYVPTILTLCEPAAQLTMRLASAQSTPHAQAA